MKIHNLVQGTPEWHAHRATHFNASDAPAMMACSPYKTRTQLLHERHTGLIPDVDNETQRRFDDGHKFEALARPLAEKIIGQELYPVTGSDGMYSASFDGLTMLEDEAFEHKSLNDELRTVMVEGCGGEVLPLMYRVQTEQQCMVSGCNRVLFMASKWDGDTLIEERHCWYYPDLKLRAQIIAGWHQFEKDEASYVPPEVKPEPVTEAVESFPVPAIQVRGELVNCNLEQITPYFDKFLAETPTKFETDDDFAQGEVNAKHSREAAKNLKLTAKAVVDQIMPVSDVVRKLEQYAAKFDALGLQLEKAVTAQKEAIKAKAISDVREQFERHVSGLCIEIYPVLLKTPAPDFAGAIKGLKKLDSLHNALQTCLANGKIEADADAKDIRGKLAWCKTNAEGYGFLFPDLQQIIGKPMDDFTLLITSRIEAHKKSEAERKAKEEADALAKQQQSNTSADAPSQAISTGDGGAAPLNPAKAANEPVADPKQAVIEHEQIIRDFMASREFGKEANKVRAVLIEFVKFQASYRMKKAA